MIASVIIPVHDREELTRRCLYRWLRQAHVAGGYELVVVDDDSREFDVAKCVEECLAEMARPTQGGTTEVQVLRLESEYIMRSPNTAYRAGIAAARAERVIVLSSQDVLTPRYALLGLLDTLERFPERRASVTVRWMSEEAQAQLAAYPWRDDLNSLGAIPGFWKGGNPYGMPNAKITDGGLFVLCSGMTRDYYEWIGGLRDTLHFGMDDRDLVMREACLKRGCKTAPELACIHQWHPKTLRIRARMAHPGFLYTCEAEARLLREARPAGAVSDLAPFKKATWSAAHPVEPAPATDTLHQPAPEWAVLLMQFVFSKVGRLGVRSVALSSDWYARDAQRLAEQAGYAVVGMGDPHADCVVSLMELQRFPTFEDMWRHRDALRKGGAKLVALTTHGKHFHGGPNMLELDEATLQAGEVDATMTGYLVGVWR